MFSDTHWNGQRKTFSFPLDHPLFPGMAKGAKQIAFEQGFFVQESNCIKSKSDWHLMMILNVKKQLQRTFVNNMELPPFPL